MSVTARSLVVLFAAFAVSDVACLGGVEAIKGKRYMLHRNCGPWMVMVGSFQEVPIERRIKGGMTAQQAADEVVYELRKLGLPAYCCDFDDLFSSLDNHSGGSGDKRFRSRQGGVAVLTCNFDSEKREDAQEILAYIKTKFTPGFLKEKKNGGILPRFNEQSQSPFGRAHMTMNPLMSDSQRSKKTRDPLIKRLNADMEYSLLKNHGKYSLRVATFEGARASSVGSSSSEKLEGFMNRMTGKSLQESGVKAWELTEALRNAKKYGYDQDFEAWVFHDRYRSIVTVGSFDSPSDPRIRTLAKRFRGKETQHKGRTMTAGEMLTIPKNLRPGQEPDKAWIFDVMPKLINVPN